jgi:RimJ/RimL family protein N-acetyltransferase
MEPFRARVSDDFSPKTIEEFIPFFLRATEQQTTWAVYRDGELGGMISFQQISPLVGTAHCVFKKSFWGHNTTIPALEPAIAEMFQTVRKLSLYVMEGNKSMISLLKKLGATNEGVLRAHTTRDGKPINVVMMALFPKVIEKKEAT